MAGTHTTAVLVGSLMVLKTFSVSGSVQKAYPRPTPILKLYFGGLGRISGTVKVKGSPNYAVARQVILFVEPQFVPLASVWSDPATGEYTFDYLDPTLKYMVVSIDYPNNFRAVLADNLSPTPMP